LPPAGYERRHPPRAVVCLSRIADTGCARHGGHTGDGGQKPVADETADAAGTFEQRQRLGGLGVDADLAADVVAEGLHGRVSHRSGQIRCCRELGVDGVELTQVAECDGACGVLGGFAVRVRACWVTHWR
jgi:hypothetical protein